MEGKLTDALVDWRTLNSIIVDATEEECMALIIEERKAANRKNVLLRIHSRYNMLRRRRERVEIMKEGR